MNSEERYNYNYNRNEVERRIRKLCAAARGTNVSILPYICKADGKFSSKKAFDFIKKLLECSDKLGTKEKKFYRDFFYCTFRCFANERIFRIIFYDNVYEEFRPCKTFQDILDKALLLEEDKLIRDREVLLNNEFLALESDRGGYNFAEEGNFLKSYFITMDLCYHRVTGKGLEAIDEEGYREYKKGKLYEEYYKAFQKLDEELIEAAYERDDEWVADFEKKKENDPTLEGFEDLGDAWDYEYEHRNDDLTDEQIEEQEEEWDEWEENNKYVEGLNALRRPAWDDFAKNFVDVEEFIDRYREFRQLFFEVDHSSFYEKIEEIIYNYMYEHRLSVFTSDDATFDEFDILDAMEARLDAAMRRTRRKYGLFE